jgi:predicted nucleic acid-binding protein
MTLLPVDRQLAQRAAELAAVHQLRGADAVYVAVAAEYGATLITWDTEQLTRAATATQLETPTTWLAGRMLGP